MAVEPGSPNKPSVASIKGAEAASTPLAQSYGLAPAPAPLDATGGENPMGVLISGILLLGAIALFIGWGLTHAYSTS